MTNPRSRNQVQINKTASSVAQLPALPSVPSDASAAMASFLGAVKERLEVREGVRGNRYEKTVTHRELQDALANSIPQMSLDNGQLSMISIPMGNGNFVSMGIEAFARSVFNTKLWADLQKGLDDTSRFDDLAQEVKDALTADIVAEAKQRGASITHLETKIQDSTRSLAMTVNEVTAGIADAAAGVRQTAFAQAELGKAVAGAVNQVGARLDDFGGFGASVESVMIATVDKANGALAEYYVKVQAGNKVAGFGLAAFSDPLGTSSSAFIVQADKFAVVSSTDTISDPNNPDASRIPFGIDTTNNCIYINGTVRINAGGTALANLAKGVSLSVPAQAFKQNTAGTWDRATIVITASLNGGLTGTPSWSVVSGTYTGSLTAGTTLTVDHTLMSTDTVTFRATVTSGTDTFTDDVTLVKLVDGANSVTVYLTNEACSVPASSTGSVTSFSAATGSMKVFNGTTDVTASATFSIAANPDTLTASINTSGVYSATAAGSWAVGSNTTSLTLRAAYNGVNYDKVFVLTKSLAGATGTTGARGSLTGYGPAYGIYLSGTGDTSDPWPTATGGNQQRANRVIENMLTGASLTTALASTADLRIGDTVTLTDAATATTAETRYWSGTAWVKPGVVIDGNLLVTGTVSADTINGGTITASAVNLGSGAFQVTTGGVVTASDFFGYNSQFGNTFDPTQPAAKCTSAASTSAETFLSITASGNSAATAHAIRGRNDHVGTSGLVGAANGYNFYADGTPTGSFDYGTFTGAHDALMTASEFAAIEVGDIVIDYAVIGRLGLSNTITEVRRSTGANQKGALGVFVAASPASLSDTSALPPNGLRLLSEEELATVRATYTYVGINALGEGEMNVCGLGGDIEVGDLIVCSAAPGKGMKQADDIVRGCTVAKAREAVTFSDSSEVKRIACIYLCG